MKSFYQLTNARDEAPHIRKPNYQRFFLGVKNSVKSENKYFLTLAILKKTFLKEE